MAGIEQLVDMFKGTPQPLEAKVQRDNKGQPPGAVPKDLQEVMALQEIAKIQQGMQNQQAMQAGGAQPSVAEKLRQIVGAMRAQGQPQMAQAMPQQPVMAARGGSLDQLISNLGRHYAGGGIIAFDGINGSKVEDPDEESLDPKVAKEIASRLEQRTSTRQRDEEDTGKTSKERLAAVGTLASAVSPLYTQALKMAVDNARHGLTKPIYPASTSATSAMSQTAAGTAFPLAVAAGGTAASIKAMQDLQAMSPEQRRALAANPMLSAMSGDAGLAAAIQEAGGEEPRENKSSYLEQMGNALATIPKITGSAGLEALKHIVSAPGYGFQSDFSSKPKPKPAATPSPTDPNFRRQTDPRMLGVSPVADDVPLITPASNSKPNTGGGGGNGGNKPGINTIKPEAMDPMETVIRDSIMKAMGRDEDQEFQKGAKRQEDFIGLDKLLQPREARIAEREGMLRKIQGERLPDWVAGLDRASKPILSGGLGTLINQYGTGKEEQKKAYNAEDLKFFDEINDMKDEVVKLKMEGKYKAAAAGQEQIKNMLADKRQAEQSGTSLLTNKENARSREQVALDQRLGREQSARQHNANMALALEEKKRQFNESELRKMREKDVDRTTKIERAIATRVGNIDLQLQMPNIKPEVKADLLRRRNEIVKQVEAEYPSIKPEKPSESQFLAAARAANPGVSDAELKAYYKQNYGT
jgi:hypothetical protein